MWGKTVNKRKLCSQITLNKKQVLACHWMMAGDELKMEFEDCQAESTCGAGHSESEGNPWPYIRQLVSPLFSFENKGLTFKFAQREFAVEAFKWIVEFSTYTTCA